MTQPIGPNQRKWLDALRSGEYRQCDSRLELAGGYCCLGVACVLFGASREEHAPDFEDDQPLVLFNGRDDFAPQEIVEALGLRTEDGMVKGRMTSDDESKCEESLAEANDDKWTFKQIADFCEAHPEAVFVEPR